MCRSLVDIPFLSLVCSALQCVPWKLSGSKREMAWILTGQDTHLFKIITQGLELMDFENNYPCFVAWYTFGSSGKWRKRLSPCESGASSPLVWGHPQLAVSLVAGDSMCFPEHAIQALPSGRLGISSKIEFYANLWWLTNSVNHVKL